MNFQHLTIKIWKSGKWFIAQAPELDFVSQGNTPMEPVLLQKKFVIKL